MTSYKHFSFVFFPTWFLGKPILQLLIASCKFQFKAPPTIVWLLASYFKAMLTNCRHLDLRQHCWTAIRGVSNILTTRRSSESQYQHFWIVSFLSLAASVYLLMWRSGIFEYIWVVSFSLTRWRGSFLYSLIFGVPVMVVMAYFMITMSAPCPSGNGSHGNDSMNGSGHGTTMNVSGCHDDMIIITPGLSLENLLLFLLCTPCQVSCLLLFLVTLYSIVCFMYL